MTKLIKIKFETKFDSINAICFVIKSSNARLISNQLKNNKNVLDIKNEFFQYFILNLRPKLNAGLILMESYKKNKLKLKYKKFK